MMLHKMAPVDAAWFHMDGPANLAMVTSVALTKKPLDFAKVKALYAARLRAFPRFRQRVVERGLPLPRPHWEDMPNFDIGQHLHHVALAQPSDQRALAQLLSDIVSTPLDRLQPLWQVHVIDGVEGGSALVTRFHHCIGDGTAMTALSMLLYDKTADVALGQHEAAAPKAGRGATDGWLGSTFDALGASVRAVVSTANAALDVATHPQALIDKAALIAGGAAMLLSELLKRDDPESPFKGPFSLAKRVAWSEPVAITDVKAIGALADAKVNDVLVAGMTGALRAYLKGRGVDVGHTTLRALVPVDLRPPERALELGNDFGLVLLELAVGARTPLERLRVTKAHMDALKRSPEPVAMRVLFDIFGRTPKLVSDIPSSMISSKASVVMTNVAGSPHTLYVAGVPIERVMFWVPHPGEHLGMGISILSYRGYATLAIVADAHLVPDPETITRRFQQEFVTMLSAARRAEGRRTAVGGRPGKATAPRKAAVASKSVVPKQVVAAGKAAQKKAASSRKPAGARKAATTRAHRYRSRRER
ncbi:Diacylglycerol O-acyltransferase [Burkholderiales bacterium]|jgi:WS/DGAT/MGAT family acyltransferase|nr:Diacylglycerol O-acyltransferase [Burkholderiales bacterium]